MSDRPASDLGTDVIGIISDHTGETRLEVIGGFNELDRLGYTFDDAWVLVGRALDEGMTLRDLVSKLGPKDDRNRAQRRRDRRMGR